MKKSSRRSASSAWRVADGSVTPDAGRRGGCWTALPNVRRVLVDTSVLFPVSVLGLLVALTEDAVHQVLWTDDLSEG